MNALARAVRLTAALFAFAATGVHAGGPLALCPDNTPVKYPEPATINLNYDRGPLGNLNKAQADTMVTAAVLIWTNVGTATVTLGRGADLPVDVTLANFGTYDPGSPSDGLNPVIYDTDGSIIDMLFGVGAKNSTLGIAGSAFSTSPPCNYLEGRAVINGASGVNDTTLGVALAHEIGHLIGMDHTQLDSTQGINLIGNRPLMYPIATRNTISLHEDDEAAVSALYPAPAATLNNVYGQISGTFVLADGFTPVRGANLWATETTTGKLYSIVSDYLTQNTGFFKLLLPAGTYNLHAGALSSDFTGGSGVGPYSDDLTGLSFQPPLYAGAVPMSTVTLGNATPTSFNINAGCAATLTFRIDGGGLIGGNCGGAGTFVLTVTKAGIGTGTVTSAPAGINCGSTCNNSFASGASVLLTASPTGGSTFSGWSGACSGTGTCTVAMTSAMSVTATFLPAAAGSEVFPAGCQLPVGWTVPATATSGWSVVANEANQGVCSLKSNTITHLEKAQIQFTGTLGAGNITFDRKVSSEAGWDCFRFFVDDVARAVGGSCANIGLLGASGEVAWGAVSVAVSAGVHTLLWSYEKDNFDIPPIGQDAAWIDAVVLPPPGNPGALQFTAGSLTVSEAVGNAVASVSRTGGSTGAASVNFVTTGASATAGTDFTAQAGTLSWGDGDSVNKPITVPIVNDALIEGNETFSITLSSPAGATLGTPATIAVTITDNDFATVPGAPTGVTATAGNAQARISFTPPVSNGGSPITGYTATCNPNALTGSASASPVNVLNLVNNTAYTCFVTANNAVGSSVASATVGVTPSASATAVLIGVVSRKTHTGVGTFDVDIPIPTNPLAVTVEPRIIGSTGHTIRFQFNNTINAVDNIAVVDSTGVTVGASSVASAGEVIVTIPALANNKRVTFTLTNVNGSVNPAPVSMGFLVGDVNNTRSVNSSDISGVKARSGQAITLTNFKFDLNASGSIGTADTSAVKARSGLVLP